MEKEDCTHHGKDTCEIKIVNEAVHKMECGKRGDIIIYDISKVTVYIIIYDISKVTDNI